MPVLAFALCAGGVVVEGATPAPALVDRPDSWFLTPEGAQIVENVRSWQNANGGWWKRYDASVRRGPGDQASVGFAPPGDDDRVWRRTSTFDNGATYSELRILARAWRLRGREDDRVSFRRGLDFVLGAQYPNGGFPQRFPIEDNYGRHITFNDGAMTGVLRLLKDIVDGQGDFPGIGPVERQRCRDAFERGIDCILACQVRVRDTLTVWCQQHEAHTLAPVAARSYELPSLSACESAEILALLMSLDRPDDPRLTGAIEAAMAWYDATRITGKRVVRIRDEGPPEEWDKRLIDDPEAPALWARFYEIETNTPFFCDRDGVKRATMAEISRERRALYRWYGPWGDEAAAEYARWKERRTKH